MRGTLTKPALQPISAHKLLNVIAENDPYFSLFASQNIQILLDKGRNDEAVKIAEKVHKAQPNIATTRLLLAQTYDSVERYKEASNVYEKLVKNTAEDQKRRMSYLILYWARSLSKAGKWQNAKKELEKGLLLKAKNPFLLNYYGYTLLNSGEDIARGFDLIKQAYDIEPNSPDITDSLGWGYFLQGNFDEAVPLLERAAKLADKDSEIQEHLGDVYWALGRKIDARYVWEAASLIAEGDAQLRLNHKTDFGLDVPYVAS